MHFSLDQILPSLEALGLWSYWIIGLASLLEAFFLAGVIVPGTLIVIGGGMLVQQGALDFFDLAWFVAVGSVVGGVLSYWTGTLAQRGLQSHWDPKKSRSYQRAARLFQRHGGLALVLGRFLGPVSGLVPFAASVAGMERRRFLIWNLLAGIPYALAYVAFGFFLGDVIAQLGPMLTRIALLATVVLTLVALLWWLIVRTERMLPFALSVAQSVLQGIADNPDVQAWAQKHPRFARFVGRRFDFSHFFGLTCTLLGLVFIYILAIWLGSVLDFLMAEPIVQADLRLANLIHAFWTPGLLRAFAHVTALGDWRVLLLVMGAALVWLWARSRRDLVMGLVVSSAGCVTSVIILKAIFHRPRPELAYFTETSGSFPSGHAAISVAFYAMLFFIAWRLKWIGPLSSAILAATLAFLIGLSRLYLIEHYLSDVLNGWLVGALWLVIGIAVAQWWKETRVDQAGDAPQGRDRQVAVLGLCALLGAEAVWQIATYDKARNVPIVANATQTVTDVSAILAPGKTPLNTESVGGTPLEPVNVVIVALDRATLEEAMQKSGWTAASKPGFLSLARAAWAAWTNQQDNSAPVTPYFWENRPNDVAFQRSTAGQTLRKRHHIRIWQSQFRTTDGRVVFVGAASFDDGLDWELLHHIDPNIDAERDTLAKDMQNAGAVSRIERVRVTAPRLGQSVAGDPWFTDGEAVVLTIK